MADRKTTLLLILDGWGHAPDDYPADKNAIATANTPITTPATATRLPESHWGRPICALGAQRSSVVGSA